MQQSLQRADPLLYKSCWQPECSVVENEIAHTQLALMNSTRKGRNSALGIGRATAPIADPFAMIGILIFLEWPRGKPSPRFAQNFSGFLNFFWGFSSGSFRFPVLDSDISSFGLPDRLQRVGPSQIRLQQMDALPTDFPKSLEVNFR